MVYEIIQDCSQTDKDKECPHEGKFKHNLMSYFKISWMKYLQRFFKVMCRAVSFSRIFWIGRESINWITSRIIHEYS